MRVRTSHLRLIPLAVLVATALFPVGCQKSDSITGPSMGSTGSSSSASMDGTWRGRYSSYSPAGCDSSSATAMFRQDGATVTGSISTSNCGVAGIFKGSVQGSQVTGNISMDGCIGGGASGTLNGSELVLSIADLTKPLVTGDKVVMYGGVVTFHR